MSAPENRPLIPAKPVVPPTCLVEFKHEGMTLCAAVPTVYEAYSRVLTLTDMLFGGENTRLVSSRDLHKALGVARNHSTWMNGMINKHNLVKDVHYIAVTTDVADVREWDALKAQRVVETNYMLLPAEASMIAMRTNSEKGEAICRYLIALAEAMQKAVDTGYKKFVKELSGKVEYLQKDRNQVHADFTAVALQGGWPSGSKAEEFLRAKETIKKLRDDLALERQKCNMLENGMKYMRSSKWNVEKCEKLFAIAQSALERAEREGECYSDPY